MPPIEQIERVFHEVLALPRAERLPWLTAHCAGDPELYEEVASLVAHHDLADAPFDPRAESQPSGVPSERFGVYLPVCLLGRGGMSAVYLAQRADGRFDKKVAVKILAAHLAGADFLRRFHNEGRFLSSLHHPNITTLIDGGISTSGQPYLVMEHVEGEPLDRYCDSRKLPIEDRLGLFLQVCRAVDYAHRNLILHRDLKPANILVTGDGSVKLLDFGTAALIDQDLEVTATRARLLTPRYASPEQLHGERPAIASDVFSLGVILYELLTGAWPYGDPQSVVSELKRATGDSAVTAPASAVTEQASQLRSQPRDRLRRTLSGDVSLIVLKALENEPARRYPTVGELAADITRFLDGHPIEARPRTLLYRSRKFLRRHWIPAAASAIFAVGLALAAIIALAQARTARTEALKSEQLNRFLTGMLSSAGDGTFDPQRFTVVQMLEAAEQRLDRDPGNDPLTTALIHRSLAESFQSLGQFQKVDLHLARAIPVFERLGDEQDLAAALCMQAFSAASQGRYDDGVRLYENTLLHLGRLGSRARPQTVFSAKTGYSSLLGFLTRRDQARAGALLDEAIALGERDSSIPRQDLPLPLTLKGGLLLDQGKEIEAEKMFLKALSVGRAVDPDGAWQFAPLYRLVVLRERRRDFAGAKEIARQMIDVSTHNVGPEHDLTNKSKVTWAYYAAKTGETDAAVRAVAEGMPPIEKAYPSPSADLWRMSLYAAMTMRVAGRFGDAERYARESLAAASAWPDNEPRVGNSWEELAADLQAENRNAEALPAFEHARSVYQKSGLPKGVARIGAIIEQLRRAGQKPTP